MNKKELNFNPNVYSKEAILEAAEDYEEVTNLSVQEFKIIIEDEEADLIAYEFANYVLSLMKTVHI